jgi:hypothetical protein
MARRKARPLSCQSGLITKMNVKPDDITFSSRHFEAICRLIRVVILVLDQKGKAINL